MKKKILVIYALFLVFTNPIKSNAFDYADEWLAKKQTQQQKYLAELEADGNLTQEAIDATKLNTNKKPNKEIKKEEKKNSNYTIIYSQDELHVIGLPTDPETGYTKSGKYDKIKQ